MQAEAPPGTSLLCPSDLSASSHPKGLRGRLLLGGRVIESGGPIRCDSGGRSELGQGLPG